MFFFPDCLVAGKLSEALRPLKKATLKSDILGFGSNNNLALGKCPIFFINQSPLLHALWQDKKGQAKTEAIYSKRKGGFVDYFSLTEAVCAELESQRCTLAREQILLFFFGREKCSENLQNLQNMDLNPRRGFRSRHPAKHCTVFSTYN